jgi:hypothetical protein
VGDGNKERLGEDPWVGSGENFRLTKNMIGAFIEWGYFFLSQVEYHDNSSIFREEWLIAKNLGFDGDERMIWETYQTTLKYRHVRIKEFDDELVWSKNLVRGQYSPKLGYSSLKEEEGIQE